MTQDTCIQVAKAESGVGEATAVSQWLKTSKVCPSNRQKQLSLLLMVTAVQLIVRASPTLV